ncbi:beta-ketoacyl-ACP synthase [Halomonas ramblicola]|uniref:beta-ketoacyl-ACP synthase n=1 Tax=Halomonas ramblicola TaxID=747349 RepID=UPI0025B3783B|nr:beta-ketoacyl-ACP synthase [Halomonas ramblicola]MDN3521798.1 beta-ketoacyl-ACP synthase [Halomonas ramblicola]
MPRTLTPRPACRLHPPAVICPLGDDAATIVDRLFGGQRRLAISDAFTPGRPLPLGRVTTPLPDDGAWPVAHRSRNNRLLAAALTRLAPTLADFRARHPEARIGVILGTSTSGIGETEAALAERRRLGDWPADFHYQRHEIGSPSAFVAEHLGLTGPAYTLSTACSSSAKALASGRRLLAAGACDAVITGGADSLCGLTVNGFSALEAVSEAPCLPFSANRDGINLGEAAALFLMTPDEGGIQLAGYGETSDAHHISAPRPDGAGARAAMQTALEMAGLTPGDVDYLNLHGTATTQNDLMEAKAVSALFDTPPPCSSTKSLTGHTLGACGALEAAFCWLALDAGRLPPAVNDGEPDPALPPLPLSAGGHAALRYALSNAFAFGGNNIALLLEKTP